MVRLPMRQLSTRDQMQQKLTTIGHRTAFNNEQSPYRIVSYKMLSSQKQIWSHAMFRVLDHAESRILLMQRTRTSTNIMPSVAYLITVNN